MPNKNFSLAQKAPSKEGSADKSKETPPAGQPNTQPDQKPAGVAPPPKT